MTLSQKIAYEILNQEEISINDLGFYLTVMRDNTSDECTEESIEKLILNLNKITK